MTLALHGGAPVRTRAMPARPQYGIDERNAANYVVASGNLSGFLAQEGEGYLGGPHVQALERAWCERFGVKYAVAMNSATSCLFGAITVLELGPAPVLTTPWSMSASATCALAAGAYPVFKDIELDTYGLRGLPDKPPKAVVLVHLFGIPARQLIAYRNYCKGMGIYLIEDACQAPGATWYGSRMPAPQPVGTFGDIGVFSLNRHKQIQAGEGGVAVTNDSNLAERLRAYRNHGEMVGFNRGFFGGNYRMGEIEAAIAKVQLERLDDLIKPRMRNADWLTEQLLDMDGIVPPTNVPVGLQPVWYLYPVRVEYGAKEFAKALTAEGVRASTYVEPLFKVPTLRPYARVDDSNDWEYWYPHVTTAYQETVVIDHVHANMTDTDLEDVVTAFKKVWMHRNDL